MDAKIVNGFLSGLKTTFEMFGINEINRGKVWKKETMSVKHDITVIVGLTGEAKGNVAYSMNQDTAKNIASMMMMGMPIAELDEMARSSIAELANMITGNSATVLAGDGITCDITPPSLMVGENMFFIISMIETIAVQMVTPMGEIEINLGIE